MGARIALLAGLLVLLPAPASAAPPANDDVGAATVVGALPFSDTVDTCAPSSTKTARIRLR